MDKSKSEMELGFHFRWHQHKSTGKDRSPPKRRPVKRFIRWLKPIVCKAFVMAVIRQLIVYLWPYLLAVVHKTTEILPQRTVKTVHCGRV